MPAKKEPSKLACKKCKVSVGKLDENGFHVSDAFCRDMLSNDPERKKASLERAARGLA